MALLAGAVWTVVDDDGTGGTGTEFDSAFVAAVKDSIEDAIHSATNPTETPATIIDEVVEARGAEASLDDRLDAIEVTVAGTPTSDTVVATLGQANLAFNELFDVWPYSDTEAPAGYVVTGAGATLARCGTGLADTNRKIGDFCARLRRVAAASTLQQGILTGSAFTRAAVAFQGKVVGIGAWVRSTSIGGARLFFNDGVGTTYSAANTAANTWEWLSVTHTINVAATSLSFGVINDVNAADAYLSAPTVFLGDSGDAPSGWVPSPVEYVDHKFYLSGAMSVGTTKLIWMPARPGIVKSVVLTAGIAPVGASMILDINTWDGAAYTSMFATPPSITAGKTTGVRSPDGTYTRRCLTSEYFDPLLEGTAVSVDVDQVGSGTAGSNVVVSIRVLHPLRYLESVLDAAYLGTP